MGDDAVERRRAESGRPRLREEQMAAARSRRLERGLHSFPGVVRLPLTPER